ncbi:ABC transporter ATP-binding protein [Nocardioides sp. GY 10127]|uniref:ABC transporter ATP-binding protein n=1 Tax=Nocardioides sp. GY 10127 TaxID=2569762 RepID=UPI0010A7ACC0|nr:ABC transporter ATP-binding protein [Nocardioides sp. GY 10127]TIC86457.1 ABC transporter ATP-binding protein [Nocardioides sp. GY 10127]
MTAVEESTTLREPILSLTGVNIYAGGTKQLVEDVTLDLGRAEALTIVGESGSGKTVLARAVAGILPDGLRVEGDVSLHEVDGRTPRVAMLLQDPFGILNPVITVGAHLEEMAALFGDGGRSVADRLAEVGIEDASLAAQYPFQLSGGLRQRVALACALACDPDVLIADEPTTALDTITQRRILDLIDEVRRQRRMALVMITHDLGVAADRADRVVVMYRGRVMAAESTAGLRHGRVSHPYTLGLLLSEPRIDRRVGTLSVVPGHIPTGDVSVPSCSYAPRCQWATDECTAGAPPLRSVGDAVTACVRQPAIAGEMAAFHAEHDSAPASVASASSTRSLVSVLDIAKEFRRGRGGDVVHAVRSASLEVFEGECVGLVGASGSGKSTVSRCIAGLEIPTSGDIILANRQLTSGVGKRDRAERAHIRHSVQMVFQDATATLNPAHRIGRILQEAIAHQAPGLQGGIKDVDALLDLVGMPRETAGRRPVSLSGGQRQRIGIARALALQPKLLVADEAVSALDVTVQAQILDLLRDLRERLGIGILFISHDLAAVRQVADRIYVMHQGQTVEHGTTEQILDHPEHPHTRELMVASPGRRS